MTIREALDPILELELGEVLVGLAVGFLGPPVLWIAGLLAFAVVSSVALSFRDVPRGLWLVLASQPIATWRQDYIPSSESETENGGQMATIFKPCLFFLTLRQSDFSQGDTISEIETTPSK